MIWQQKGFTILYVNVMAGYLGSVTWKHALWFFDLSTNLSFIFIKKVLESNVCICIFLEMVPQSMSCYKIY